MDADYAETVREGTLFVAEDDGGIAGAIVLVPEGDHLEVENVAVEPGRQGGGIGRALLAFAEEQRPRAAGSASCGSSPTS